MPDLGVISASHDQTLRLWDYAGTCMAEFVGHTAIVYAAAGSAQVGLGKYVAGCVSIFCTCCKYYAAA